MGATAFRLRRVMMGVVAGAVIVSLGFYGWVQYRQAQYRADVRGVISHYQDNYQLCTAAGNAAVGCATQVMTACLHDSFWASSPPFASDPGGGGAPDPLTSCRSAIAAG